MELKTLHDLFVDQLKDLYSAENQLVKALPKMAKKATTPDLRKAFEDHLQETEQQVERLTKVGELLDVALRGKKCAAMEGLIEEGKELMGEKAEPAVMDAGLIAAAQKVEHYEIASYGTVCTWAEELGLPDVRHLLAATLAEEKAADDKLSELAELDVNEQADAAPEGEANGKGQTSNGRAGKGRKTAARK